LKGLRVPIPESQATWLAASSLLFGLLVMTRPDGALTYGLIWLHAVWRFRTRPRNLALFTIPFLILYAPYFLWRLQYYGLFFPNTLYAKQGGSLVLYARGAARIRNFLGLQAGGLLVAGAVALSVLLFGAVESTVLGLAILARLLFELWSGGEWSGYFRFLVPALPFFWILTERVCVGWVRTAKLGRRGYYALAGLLALMLVNQAAHFTSIRNRLFEPHHVGFERAHIALGKWLKQNSPPHATIAIGAIGAVPFYSDLRVIDLVGLGDAHVARLPGALYTKADPAYVLSRSPEYIVLLPRHCEPSPTDFWSAMEKGIYESSQFQERYQHAGCWDFIEGYHLVLYRRKADAPVR
jgi:arabinofuranosyltransferase